MSAGRRSTVCGVRSAVCGEYSVATCPRCSRCPRGPRCHLPPLFNLNVWPSSTVYGVAWVWNTPTGTVLWDQGETT